MRDRLRKIYSLLFADAIVTSIAFVLVGIFSLFLLNISFLNPVGHALDNFTTTDIYYAIQNEAEAEESDMITLVDITKLYSRDSIATVLENVAKCDPAVIGVDITFERPHLDDADDHLEAVVDDIRDNTVFAYKLTDYDSDKQEFSRVVHSFFSYDGEAQLHEGFVNISHETVHDIPLWQQIDGVKHPSMINQVASLWNNKPAPMDGEQIAPINYPPTSFCVVPFDSIEHYKHLIANRIVLVGGVYEAIDICYTPLGTKHGIVVMAYGIQTLLSEQGKIRISGHTFLHLLITILLVLFTCLLRHSYTSAVSKLSSPRLQKLFLTSFVETILTSIWMVIIVLLGFQLFYYFAIDIELKLALEVIFFVSIARDIYKIFIQKEDSSENKLNNQNYSK